MTKAAATTTKRPDGAQSSVMGTIFVDMLDTGWRIATPTLLFVIFGIVIDRKTGWAPLATLVGLVLGLGGAGLLVKKQLQTINRRQS